MALSLLEAGVGSMDNKCGAAGRLERFLRIEDTFGLALSGNGKLGGGPALVVLVSALPTRGARPWGLCADPFDWWVRVVLGFLMGSALSDRFRTKCGREGLAAEAGEEFLAGALASWARPAREVFERDRLGELSFLATEGAEGKAVTEVDEGGGLG